MLSLITLTLVSPIPKHCSQICIHSPHQPLIVEKGDEIVSGRDLIAAPLFAAFEHRQNLSVSISSPNDCSWPCLWPCLICFPNIGFHWQSRRQQSGSYTTMYLLIIKLLALWSLDKSIKLGVMICRSSFESSDNDDALPLKNLPPAYTYVEASTSSLGQQGTGSIWIDQPIEKAPSHLLQVCGFAMFNQPNFS